MTPAHQVQVPGEERREKDPLPGLRGSSNTPGLTGCLQSISIPEKVFIGFFARSSLNFIWPILLM